MTKGLFPLNRALSCGLIPWFVRWGVSANQVTTVSLIAGLAAGLFLLQGRPFAFALGAILFILANLLDECDGGVARATGKASGLGSWFDTATGCLVHIVFFFSLGVGLTRQTGSSGWAVLGSATALGVLLSTAAFVAAQAWARGRDGWIHPDPPRGVVDTDRLEWLKTGLRSDFSWVVLLAAWLGGLGWILRGALLGTYLFWIPGDLRAALRLRRRLCA